MAVLVATDNDLVLEICDRKGVGAEIGLLQDKALRGLPPIPENQAAVCHASYDVDCLLDWKWANPDRLQVEVPHDYV